LLASFSPCAADPAPAIHYAPATKLTGDCCAPAPRTSASGLKRQDNDLIVIESAEAAASFKHTFEAQFASGEGLAEPPTPK
jgi:hypothetical protein